MSAVRPVYVVGANRIPFVKSMTSYGDISSYDLMTTALRGLVERYKLQNKLIGDVAFGAVMHSSARWNLTREVVLEAGLHPYTPGYNVQRACGTSLETTIQLAHKIAFKEIDTAISGGVDSNSDLPIMISNSMRRKLFQLNGAKSTADKFKAMADFRPSDLKPLFPAVAEPRTGLSMGQHCERMVQEWKISREDQDLWAFESHQKAAAAQKEGFFNELMTPTAGVNKDSIVRGDTTLERLAKLKPVFDLSGKGTLTAGNSSPLTDGAATVLLASESAIKENSWTPLARIVDSQTTALDFVNGDGLLMAPTTAVGKLLDRNKLSFDDFDFVEIHEAFAGQVLCTLRAWESKDYCKKYLGISGPLGPIPRERINVKGSSLSIGHPFAATGARIVGTLAKLLHSRKKSRGLISICTAGGMGVAAILESVE